MILAGAKIKGEPHHCFIYSYFDKLMLRKLGYSFDSNNLEAFEVDAYNVVARAIREHQERELEKSRKKRK